MSVLFPDYQPISPGDSVAGLLVSQEVRYDEAVSRGRHKGRSRYNLQLRMILSLRTNVVFIDLETKTRPLDAAGAICFESPLETSAFGLHPRPLGLDGDIAVRKTRSTKINVSVQLSIAETTETSVSDAT